MIGTRTQSGSDDLCLNVGLVTPLESERKAMSRITKEQYGKNNEILCKLCPQYNDICEDVD